jgi:hypothetical protein
MRIATQPTLKHILLLNLHPLWALRHLMPYLRAVVTYIVRRLVLKQVLIQHFRLLEVLLHEYLWMVVRALTALLAVPVHIVPAQFADYVLVLA